MELLLPKDLVNTRRSVGSNYFLFALHFICIVVGKKKFESYCYRFPFSEIVKPSDETFALLIFENNYDRWMSMAVNDHWTSSCVKPAYTSGGNVIQTPKTPNSDVSTKNRPKGSKKTVTEKPAEINDSQIATTSKFQG